MKTIKLMVVNATQEKDRKYVGETFSAIKAWPFSGNDHEITTGSLKGYVVNPIDIDEDLTIRVGSGPDDILFHLRKVSKASPRKLLVRAMKRIAKERGYTNAYIRKFGTFAGVGIGREPGRIGISTSTGNSILFMWIGCTTRNTIQLMATNGEILLSLN